jgi:RNA polymerase sigma factor (sigma-70 family)
MGVYHPSVPDLPITTTVLLNSLKDERDNVAWTEFDSRYRRVIEDFARSAGLRDDDAVEVAQQTLVDFVKSYRLGRYSRERGRLHSWIIGIAQNKVADCFRAKARAAIGGTDSATFDLSDSQHVTQVFEQHMQQAIFTRAMERLKLESQMDETTVKAFELVAVRGVTVEAAARECGMKPSEIYVAKHRVLSKLRKLVEEITAAWDE